MDILKRIATAVYLLALIYLSVLGFEQAADTTMLIPLAFPAALVLVIALRVFGPKAELAGWSVFTIVLGGTYWSAVTAYLGTSYLGSIDIINKLEVVVFVAYLGLSLFGAFKSPYFLAFACLFHPVWDLVPRDLPGVLKDLPMSSVLFDLPIGLYILWFAYQNRWTVFSLKPAPRNPRGIT
jgi:hypothetical protein